MGIRILRSLGAATIFALVMSSVQGSSLGAAAATTVCGTDLKLLVVAADGNEPSLGSIKRTLEYLGTPYDVVITATQPAITAAQLGNGCRNFYQGIIFTTAELVYSSPTGFVSALEPGEQATIHTYAIQAGARELVWFSDWAGPAWGINWPSGGVDTTATPITAAFTPAGAAIFSHVNTANPLTIKNAWTILTTPADASVTPLLVDAAGHSLAVAAKFPDGRETLTLTFASNQYLIHSLVLGYDLVNWVTKGIFVGERHAYMSPQIDDLFLGDLMWTPDLACGTSVDSTTAEFRLKAADITALVKWQTALRANPLTAGVKLTWAYNGWGAFNTEPDDVGVRFNKHRITSKKRPADDLPAAVTKNASAFYFVSHTWDHPMFDTLTAPEVTEQLVLNLLAAVSLKLNVDPRELVTPNVSGLTNPAAMQTAYALGVRYIVTDTSIAGYGNPTPNTGLYNPLAPGLFMIPRYPTNLYFNVSTPAEWTAEYNCIYGPKGSNFWGRDLTYQEILDNISDTWVSYLLDGDLNPLMFHQPNARAYDGTHSLLGDLIDLTVAKYGRLVKFPILSPSMAQVGDMMIARQKYNQAGVVATLVPGGSVVVTATQPAVVPITGLKITGAETYAGQSIGHVTLTAGETKTVKPAL